MISKPSGNIRRISRLSVFLLMVFALSTSCWSDAPDASPVPPVYRNPSEVRTFLDNIHAAYPLITSVEIVGTSVLGEDIPALVISDNPDDPAENEPRVRLTGTMHGNEYISGAVLQGLITDLTEGYASSDSIKALVNSRYIVIIPVVNPDGMRAGTRRNAHGVDLNRNFSKAFVAGSDHGAAPFSEPESAALRDYSTEKIFHLSATFHSGAVIVNLPWDYIRGSLLGVPVPENRPLEDELLWALGKTYSLAGTFLANPDMLTDPDVDEGVINGGDWYIINGSLQDWSYVETGCIEITVEVADSSPGSQEGVDEVYAYNREGLLAYIKAAGMGVSGYVEDDDGNPLSGVAVKVTDGDIITRTDENGWFHRILLDGEHTLEFSREGYVSATETVTALGVLASTVNLPAE